METREGIEPSAVGLQPTSRSSGSRHQSRRRGSNSPGSRWQRDAAPCGLACMLQYRSGAVTGNRTRLAWLEARCLALRMTASEPTARVELARAGYKPALPPREMGAELATGVEPASCAHTKGDASRKRPAWWTWPVTLRRSLFAREARDLSHKPVACREGIEPSSVDLETTLRPTLRHMAPTAGVEPSLTP